MMKCPRGFNQCGYCKVTGGSAFSCFAAALLIYPINKRFVSTQGNSNADGKLLRLSVALQQKGSYLVK